LTKQVSEIEIRKAVKERYSKLALNSEAESCCNDDSCCGPSLVSSGDVPAEATSVYASCGSPLALISLKEGDSVVDLGSGGGIDVFRASRIIGAKGKAIGIDSTPEMIWRARETKQKYGEKYSNTEFRLGEIEHIPLESNSVDYVISNCVINLAPDKLSVFKDSYRILKNNGVFAVADVTLQKEIPESARKNMDVWTQCMTGALTDTEYKRLLEKAGFQSVSIEHISSANIGDFPFKHYSSHIKAIKKS
jgi:arsenite methyltransferase